MPEEKLQIDKPGPGLHIMLYHFNAELLPTAAAVGAGSF